MGCRSYLPNGGAHDVVVRLLKRCSYGDAHGKNRVIAIDNFWVEISFFFASIPGYRCVRARTLEGVVKYDQKAFTKAWDYLASSSSDDEDVLFFFNVFFKGFFWTLFLDVF